MPDLDGLHTAAKPLCKVSLLTLVWNHVVSSALKLEGLILCFTLASQDYIQVFLSAVLAPCHQQLQGLHVGRGSISWGTRRGAWD